MEPKDRAWRRITLGMETYLDMLDRYGPGDKLTMIFMHRVRGMIAIFKEIFPEDGVDVEDIFVYAEQEVNRLGKLPR